MAEVVAPMQKSTKCESMVPREYEDCLTCGGGGSSDRYPGRPNPSFSGSPGKVYAVVCTARQGTVDEDSDEDDEDGGIVFIVIFLSIAAVV